MFCSNCGKQLGENARFCDGCGAQQGVVNNDANSASNQQTPDPQPNVNYQAAPVAAGPQAKKTPKKKNIIITAAVVLCAFIIGKFVIAPSMLSDSGSGSTGGNLGNIVSNTENTVGSTDSQTQTDTSSSTYSSSTVTTGSAYDDILTQAYIVHFQPFFNMETASFVYEQDDGTICCADYGYKDDVVKQWIETMYLPVSECTDAQKTELENTMKTQFATVDALNCCTVTYKMSTNYFTITCTYSDVDKSENYSELYNANILQTNTFVSMSATEQGLLNQGFIKK